MSYQEKPGGEAPPSRKRAPLWVLPLALVLAWYLQEYLSQLAVTYWLKSSHPELFLAGAPDPRAVAVALRSLPVHLWGGVIGAAVFALVALSGALLAKEPLGARLRLARPGVPLWGVLLFALGATAIGWLFLFFMLLSGVEQGGSLEQIKNALAQARGLSLALAIAQTGVLTGLGEELFFRGFLQTGLRRRLGAWPAIVLSAGIFGFFHYDWWQSPMAFLMGLYLGYGLELTGSIWVPVAAHAFNNSLAALFESLPDEWRLRLYLPLLLLWALSFPAALFWMAREGARRQAQATTLV
jgi:uncharacterized protein